MIRRVVVFDLDNTLTESKSPITPRTRGHRRFHPCLSLRTASLSTCQRRTSPLHEAGGVSPLILDHAWPLLIGSRSAVGALHLSADEYLPQREQSLAWSGKGAPEVDRPHSDWHPTWDVLEFRA
jgi:hypothetical protein